MIIVLAYQIDANLQESLKDLVILMSNINFYHLILPVGVEHLIALLTSQCFQIQLTPRMFPVWDFVVGIFARKTLLNMGHVLSTHSC